MKRFLFSVCALAAVVVGCSKSEVLNRPNAEVPIEFNPYAGRVPVTRATADNIKTLGTEGFQVYAFFHGESGEPDWASPYMNKVVKYGKKTEDATTDTWYYSGHAYWPASKELAFIAYGLNAIDQITPVNGALQKIDFTVANDVASQKDLLVAAIQRNQKYIEGDTGDGTVNFTFSHLLSRIGFSLVTKDNNTVPVTIEQVKLEGTFYEKGTVDLSIAPTTTIKIGGEDTPAPRPVIEPGESKEITYDLLTNGSYTSYGSADGTPIYNNSMLYTKKVGVDGPDDDEYVENNFKDAEGTVDANAKKTAEDQAAANLLNRYMMIIPTTTPGISSGQSATTLPHNAHLKVLYFLPGAGTFDEVDVDLSAIQFEPGKSYNFKFKVSTAGISFSVTVEDWDETGNSGDTIKLN